ncbi:3-dehydrosphinganine reductase [Friedmanniomyces endolithicus]|uniref:3-dehydrosphinganine reductase n=1 Tax=Rachicladosporium monterosium TaxID=1507873 RepID=A0ABR0LGK6_9PEZI|nr:3-dehydrosphinganine reductase [Friedmanniomyces endolithicus]KAK1094387.1 3-dehydrosphinganine reductase [Friedmanniomyces endolithicus]KAK1809540.1 3-dehydrosphinganine reductase [Friedmanniomyces endolithicus]KAK5148470.1 3-dehydrosphinganine reductase [Rachicladosporium monterosium]
MALGLYWATACLAAFIAVLTLDISRFFSRKNHFDVDGKTVVITGGSQGLGRGLARLLSSKGANVVIVARDQPKIDIALKYTASAAKSPQSQRFHGISADVRSPEENTRLLEEVTRWNDGQPPDIVWANAGSSHPALFIDTTLETLRSQMDINYWAATYLAHATLRLWLKPSSTPSNTGSSYVKPAQPRHFIITGSSTCFVGVAGYAPYSPAKSALRSLADTLRSELNLYNGYRRANPQQGPVADVKVHCVVPGTIQSPGLAQENLSKHPVTRVLEEGDPIQTEDEVAAAAVKGLERDGYLITTQWLGHAMRAGTLGGSPRNNWLFDTVCAWVVNVAWLYIGPDMEGKVFEYGKSNEVKLPS